MTQTFNTKSCPFCEVAEPAISRIHGEVVAECCNGLLIFVERQDPDGETGLMQICFDRASALADWRGCVEFAASRINSQMEAAK